MNLSDVWIKGNEMKKLIVLCIVLFSSICFGQFKVTTGNPMTTIRFSSNSVLRIHTVPELDGWSSGHVLAGVAISRSLKIAGVESYTKRLLYTAITSVFHEIYFDGFGNKLPFIGSSIITKEDRGADLIGDVFFTVLGAFLDITFDYMCRAYVIMNNQVV